MKNHRNRLPAAVLSLLLILSLAACGSAAPSEPEPSSSAPEPVSSETAVLPEETPGPVFNDNGKFDTLAEFIRSDAMQDQLKTIQNSVKDAGMDLELLTEGEKLIYLYVMHDVSSEDVEAISGTLSTLLEGQEDTFRNVAASLREAVEIQDPTVEVRYETEDGTLICSREFEAD